MGTQRTFYITTPIYYPNARPHIGHGYTTIACDVLARFHRLDGRKVHFLTGTDEHGLKIKQAAIQAGTTPKQLVDELSTSFREMTTLLNISNDDFIRTTEPRHYAACQELWRRMDAAGDIYLDRYSGWYSVRQEAYFDESETTVGEDGVRREPIGSPVEWTEETTYRFRLSKYQQKLLDYYAANPDFIMPPERRNEVVSFVTRGLEDISISRATLDWGIPVPNDPSHVMYVWTDALTNYISAVGYPDTNAELFKDFWPADLHMVGKDIVRFHCIYWPAFLMSAGVAPPKRVFAHGLLLGKGGRKISKSEGAPPISELVDELGADALRYFVMREATFGQDGGYTDDAMINRINADLANDLGNLAQRSLSMIAKNCGGTVPQPGPFSEADTATLALADGMAAKAREAIERVAIHRYLDAVWSVVGEANRYFAGEQPWAKRTSDPQRMGTILYVTAEVLRQVAILAQPITPAAAGRLLDQLGQPDNARDFAHLGAEHRLAGGLTLPEPSPVFPRYLSPEEREAAAKRAQAPRPGKGGKAKASKPEANG
jgi:methionyl-tRNA synthetase